MSARSRLFDGERVVSEKSCFFDKEKVMSEDGRGAYLIDRELCQSRVAYLIKRRRELCQSRAAYLIKRRRELCQSRAAFLIKRELCQKMAELIIW